LNQHNGDDATQNYNTLGSVCSQFFLQNKFLLFKFVPKFGAESFLIQFAIQKHTVVLISP